VEPDEVKNWIDYAINSRLTLILLFHKIENDIDESQMKYKKNDFYQIIDYIDQNKNELNIITYSDWIQSII
jgi:hypothetical protein